MSGTGFLMQIKKYKLEITMLVIVVMFAIGWFVPNRALAAIFIYGGMLIGVITVIVRLLMALNVISRDE
jgi:hypothetical protein